jgi:thiamine-phosphate pyrophosphorylase
MFNSCTKYSELHWPFRFSLPPLNREAVLGLEGYRSILQKLKQQRVEIPIYAIGGITSEN